MMTLPDILLIMSGVLLLAMIAASLCRQLTIPYTALLVVLGLVTNFFADGFSLLGVHHFKQFQLTSELVLFVFLPALVFESALSLDARALLKNIVPILILAIIGMLVSVVLVGIGIEWSLNIPIIVALLFASLISATDPVAVISIFKELGVSRHLNILIEGESLMNDATAIVLFSILLTLLTEPSFSLGDGIAACLHFIEVFFGGILVGLCTGILLSEILVRLYHDNQNIPVVLSLTLAYISFIIAEHELHVSGVMAVLSAAICLNIMGLSRLPKETTESIHSTWEFIVLIFNSLLFVLIGLSVNLQQLAASWQAILWAVLAVYIARGVSVYLLLPISTRLLRLQPISWSERHIMWWGGLKGGLAIAIVMSIPDSLPEKSLLESLTLGVVLVSMLVNAPTIRWLMHFLKMDVLDKKEQAELKQSMQQVTESTSKILHRFADLQLLDSKIESNVESQLHHTLDSTNITLSNDSLVKQAHLHALRAEGDEIEYLYEIGMINYYTLVTFKDILRTDQQHSIDYLNKMGVGWLQPNPLLNIERLIIHYLSEKDWAQTWLMRYQTRRFSNKILHDLAGILMAHKGLKTIQAMTTNGLDKELIKPIQEIYAKRLKRRQNRLQYFKKNYPLFYRQYETHLFQKVSLQYSQKLVHKSHEQGLISAKVRGVINHKLNDSSQQLDSFKISLRLVERHGWINKVPLFTDLPEMLLQKMAERAKYVNFLPDDTVIYQGDNSHSLYILISGYVDIFLTDEQGNMQYVTQIGAGELIGVHALIDDSTRSATVKAKTYATCLRLTAKDILNLAQQYPVLNERLQQTESRIKYNGQSTTNR